MIHDNECPVELAGGSCCPWLPNPCDCQCICEMVDHFRTDEQNKAVQRLLSEVKFHKVVIDGSLRMVCVAEEAIAAIKKRNVDG